MIKIRLARGGRVHKPFYNIVAIEKRSAVNGRCLQFLGSYDPNAKEHFQNLNKEAIAQWVNKGAICSDTLTTLFKKNNIVIE